MIVDALRSSQRLWRNSCEILKWPQTRCNTHLTSRRASVRKGGLDVEARAQHLFGGVGDPDEDKRTPALRPIKDIKLIFQSSGFCLKKLQDRIEKLIFYWNVVLFRNQEAELWSIGYNLPICFRDSQPSGEIDEPRFQQAENSTQGQRPNEPADEQVHRRNKSPSRKAQSRSPLGEKTKLQLTPKKRSFLPRQTSRRNSPYWTEEGGSRRKYRRESPSPKKRQIERFSSPGQTSITALDFGVSCDTPETGRRSAPSVSSSGRGPVSLGAIPLRVNAVLRNGRGPDEGRFTETGRVRKRIKWTIEEEKALRVGIKKHGVGSWAVIKDEFEDLFRNRTSVMLKDKYRVLLKNGAIDVDGESVASDSS